MLFLKLGQIVDIFINDYPQIVPLVMRCDIALREGFGHGYLGFRSEQRCSKMAKGDESRTGSEERKESKG